MTVGERIRNARKNAGANAEIARRKMQELQNPPSEDMSLEN